MKQRVICPGCGKNRVIFNVSTGLCRKCYFALQEKERNEQKQEGEDMEKEDRIEAKVEEEPEKCIMCGSTSLVEAPEWVKDAYPGAKWVCTNCHDVLGE